MKNCIKIGYTEYLLPSDLDSDDIEGLVGTIASFQEVDSAYPPQDQVDGIPQYPSVEHYVDGYVQVQIVKRKTIHNSKDEATKQAEKNYTNAIKKTGEKLWKMKEK